jgi:hypothetical protein
MPINPMFTLRLWFDTKDWQNSQAVLLFATVTNWPTISIVAPPELRQLFRR